MGCKGYVIPSQFVMLQFHACWNYKYHSNLCQVYPEDKANTFLCQSPVTKFLFLTLQLFY